MKKILYIVPRLPDTLEKGDKLRAYHFLRLLSQNHKVYLLAAEKDSNSHIPSIDLSKLAEKIFLVEKNKWQKFVSMIFNTFQSVPFQVKWFSHSKIQKAFSKIYQEVQPNIIICHTVRMAELMRNHKTQAYTILDYQDAFGLNMEKRIDKEPIWFRALMRMETQRLKRYENLVFDNFDEKIIISENDALHIPHPENKKIKVVANGVEFPVVKSQNQEIDFLFVGNMSYLPNVEAVTFFSQKVLPIIWKSNPDANFYIVGNQPSNRVMELSNDRIKITGWVDDVNEFYQKSKVFVAPMLISTGLQNKILEAMANQTTCLISESANLALKAKNSIEVITAQSENEFAEWAIKLLNNRDLRENIGKSGKEFVNNHYSWEAVGLQLEEILKPNYI